MKNYILILLNFVFITGCYSGPTIIPFEMDTTIQDKMLGKWKLIGTGIKYPECQEYLGESKYMEFTKNMADSYGDCVSSMNSEYLHLCYMVTASPVVFFYTPSPPHNLEDYQYRADMPFWTDTLILHFRAGDRWFDKESENNFFYYFKKLEE